MCDKLLGIASDFVVDDGLTKYDEWEDQATLLSCVECGRENITLFEYVELHGHCVTCYDAEVRKRESSCRAG